MSLVPTPAQIRAQVAAVWKKAPGARVIGIRIPGSVETGPALRVEGEDLAVSRCQSVLEVRARLADLEGGKSPLVLLTPLEESELGADVVARLAKRQLFMIEPWQLVKERFQARYVDPRLVERHSWVARALLEAEPEGGYPPAPSGFIQAELAWRILFESLIGLPGGQRDPEALLDWVLGGPDRARLEGMDAEVREGLCDAVAESAGKLAGRIFAATLEGKDAFAVGLVARTLYGEEAGSEQAAIKATGKLESYLGDVEIDQAIAEPWADAAESVIERRLAKEASPDLMPLIRPGDDLLSSLGASDCAHRSRFLLASYTQRQTQFAEALDTFVAGKATAVPADLWEAGDRVLEHVLADHEGPRSERIEMALRLAGWLALQRGRDEPKSFSEAAREYRDSGGFADWARTRIWDGDSLGILAQAYTRLSEAVDEVREAQNGVFGRLFSNWSETGSHDAAVLRVEHVLDRVVGPLASQNRVLVAMIDGMSVSVFRELQADLFRRGWIEVVPGESRSRVPVISAIPSLTEVSRASLLCGKLTTGKQNLEKDGFSKHAALVECSGPTKPPVLFHKGELRASDSVGLAPAVVGEVSDPHRRVVGVVINAVDDHLAKGEQVRVDWSAHRIRPLEELVVAARDASRAVVLVSDHGHLLEHGTEGRSQGDSDRWREYAGKLESDEVLLQGPRVMLGKEGRVVAAWSERVRFGSKKNGYHGGAAPQEVVIPLAVFVPSGLSIEGWNESAPDMPDWWERPDEPAATPPKRIVTPKPPVTKGETGELFPVGVGVGTAAGLAWIDSLLESEQMVAQRAQAARTHLSDDRLRMILTALDERGGKLTRAALAKRLGVPSLRIGGILSALRRVLNVEGYAVLSVDEASDTVELNRTLLDAQFGL